MTGRPIRIFDTIYMEHIEMDSWPKEISHLLKSSVRFTTYQNIALKDTNLQHTAKSTAVT